MRFKTKFLIILLIFIVLNIAAVSANDVNVTDSYQLDGNGFELVVDDYSNGGDDSNSSDVSDDANITEEMEVIKSTPKISVKSTKVKSKDTLTIYLKNSSGDPIKSKKLTASIGSKKYSITTNSKGAADLNINLATKTHKVTVSRQFL